mmetsp:Transcript_22137/g.54546  ORF Transcript_22137/g.54546 Transcript_22137/m.54546 type:complete len:88 (+) Transcript_22137:118-381(+)
MGSKPAQKSVGRLKRSRSSQQKSTKLFCDNSSYAELFTSMKGDLCKGPQGALGGRSAVSAGRLSAVEAAGWPQGSSLEADSFSALGS